MLVFLLLISFSNLPPALSSPSSSIHHVPSNNLFQASTSNAWALDMLHVPKAWEFSRGNGSSIALIDAGLATTLFPNNLWINNGEIANNGLDDDNNGLIDDIHGWNFLENSSDISDHSPRSHGTSVSSILLETAPEAVIMMIKLLDNEDHFSSSSYPKLDQALLYIKNNDIDVLYMPLHLPVLPQV